MKMNTLNGNIRENFILFSEHFFFIYLFQCFTLIVSEIHKPLNGFKNIFTEPAKVTNFALK